MIEDRILLVAEANEKVASGHLFECIACYEELCEKGKTAFLMVNSDMSQELKSRIPGSYSEYVTDIQMETDYLINFVRANGITIIVFNLREIRNEFLQNFKNRLDNSIKIVVIDEFGRRKLESDIIINPMIDNYYWEYDTAGKIYCGAEYLILPRNLRRYHKEEKEIRENVEIVTVSMGGVDAKGTTIKLARWLNNIEKNIHVNLVLGGAFKYREKLNELMCGMEDVRVYQNISYLYDLFMESDIAVCAGGNTLHELAALGVPALVIPNMPHEMKNGRAFEERGFSICGEDAEHMTEKMFGEYMNQLLDIKVRKKMSNAGKMISDGNGVGRVYQILMSEI